MVRLTIRVLGLLLLVVACIVLRELHRVYGAPLGLVLGDTAIVASIFLIGVWLWYATARPFMNASERAEVEAWAEVIEERVDPQLWKLASSDAAADPESVQARYVAMRTGKVYACEAETIDAPSPAAAPCPDPRSSSDTPRELPVAMLRLNMHQRWAIGLSAIALTIALAVHNPFGGYRRDDGLYSRQEFISMYRSTYPQYGDVSDAKLWGAIVRKHPELLSWVRGASAPTEAVLPADPLGWLTPPPAYSGESPSWRSSKAHAAWIDEPSEFLGVMLLIALLCSLWCWLFGEGKKIQG